MIRVLSFIYRMIFWTWQATNPNILQTWPCVYKLVHPLYLLLCPPKMNWGLPPRLLLLLLFLLRPQKLNWTIQAWSWRILTVGIRMCKLYIVSIVDIACVIFDLRLLLIHTMGHNFFSLKKNLDGQKIRERRWIEIHGPPGFLSERGYDFPFEQFLFWYFFPPPIYK